MTEVPPEEGPAPATRRATSLVLVNTGDTPVLSDRLLTTIAWTRPDGSLLCYQPYGEPGLLELICLVGYFTTLSMVMNVAHTPVQAPEGQPGLEAFPL